MKNFEDSFWTSNRLNFIEDFFRKKKIQKISLSSIIKKVKGNIMSNTEMTFLEHLQEMRSRILNSLIAFIFFAIIGYYYSNLIISFLLNPINDTNVNLQALKITSIFSTKIIISFFFGVIFSFPVIVYQFLMFTLPALDNKFKTYKIILFIFMASSLFLFGLLLVITF